MPQQCRCVLSRGARAAGKEGVSGGQRLTLLPLSWVRLQACCLRCTRGHAPLWNPQNASNARLCVWLTAGACERVGSSWLQGRRSCCEAVKHLNLSDWPLLAIQAAVRLACDLGCCSCSLAHCYRATARGTSLCNRGVTWQCNTASSHHQLSHGTHRISTSFNLTATHHCPALAEPLQFRCEMRTKLPTLHTHTDTPACTHAIHEME